MHILKKIIIFICLLLSLNSCEQSSSINKSDDLASISTEKSVAQSFSSQSYRSEKPDDSTIRAYDEERFSMITGTIFQEDGTPLTGVKISIYKHPEYGTTITDTAGKYTIPAEGGVLYTLRYSKSGYTTLDRLLMRHLKIG